MWCYYLINLHSQLQSKGVFFNGCLFREQFARSLQLNKYMPLTNEVDVLPSAEL